VDCPWGALERRANLHLKLACNSVSIAVAQGFCDEQFNIKFALILFFQQSPPIQHPPIHQPSNRSSTKVPTLHSRYPGDVIVILPGVFSRRGKHASDPQTHSRTGLFPRGTIGDKPSYSVFFAADGSDNAFGRLPSEV
jgi:hypothetical protein